MNVVQENSLPFDVPPIVPSNETVGNICIKIQTLFENATEIIGSIDELRDAEKEPFYANAEALMAIIRSCQYEAEKLGDTFVVMCCMNSSSLLRCARGEVDMWIACLTHGPVATVVSHAYNSITHSVVLTEAGELPNFESLSDELQLEYAMRVLIVKLQKGLVPLASLTQWIGPEKGPLEVASPLQQHVYQQLLDLSAKLVLLTRLRVERLWESVCNLPGRERFWPRQFDAIREAERVSEVEEGKGKGKGKGDGDGEEDNNGGIERVWGGETSIEELED